MKLRVAVLLAVIVCLSATYSAAQGLGYAGNGPQQIYEGDVPPTGPDCLIWDIDGANAIDLREAFSSSLTSSTLTLGDDWIADANGNVLCSADLNHHGASYLREGADGDVLLTVWNRYVFDGEVTFPSPASTHKQAVGAILKTRAFEFHKDQIFAGKKSDGVVLATSTAHIQNANPMRKLLLTALVAGECGSLGLSMDSGHDW